MRIVQTSLTYRVTIFVIAIAMLVGGTLSAVVTKKDVLPSVDIPVVVIIWTYTGLSAEEMASRVTTYSEYSLNNNVNNIKRVESQTLQGASVIKVYFDTSVSIDLAIAQVVSSVNSIRATMPPGIQAPNVVRFSASSVPVIQLALSSATKSGAELYDYAMYRIRQALNQVPGSTLPVPYGGAPRQIMVDLDLKALQSVGMTPNDVIKAVTAHNVVTPSGLLKVGAAQLPVRLDTSPTLQEMNGIPVKVVDGAPVLLRDVAYVRDGAPPPLNVVRSNGQNSVLVPIIKNGTASTLSVVDAVKAAMPSIRAAAPKDIEIKTLFDQSIFVSNAIKDVVREAVIAASLTGLAIFVFLGSWRSTLVVLVSIPLSILTSLSCLSLMGQTINVITLGGLAMSIGILVDDATVAVENIYRLMEDGHSFQRSVIDGAEGIAKPALVSTLAICSAFVGVFFLTEAPRFLFAPQALAVVFAMLASYFLSRTLVPVLVARFIRSEHEKRRIANDAMRGVARLRHGFEAGYARVQRAYVAVLEAVVARRAVTLVMLCGVFVGSGAMMMAVGSDYFPKVNSGRLTLHIRAPTGMRLEETDRRFASVEKLIRRVVPEIDSVITNIGLPSNNYNFAFTDGSQVGFNDGVMLITLKDDAHETAAAYATRLRSALGDAFPDLTIFFQPPDMITQILDFGTMTPIDVQITGRHPAQDLAAARRTMARLKTVEGIVDVHLHQIVDAPVLVGKIDRQLSSEIGVDTQTIASDLNIALSGSFQVTPNFWSDPVSRIPYPVSVQVPEYRDASVAALETMPVFALDGTTTRRGGVTLMKSVVDFRRQPEQVVVNHLNAQPVYDILAGVEGRDLGSVAAEIDRIVDEEKATLPAPDTIVVRGQIEQMRSAFFSMQLGLVVSLFVVYLLMVVNYQSWADPLIVLMALPLASCGIVTSLFVTQTPFSIPSLFGAIMSVGVASANSILLVTFAREHRLATRCSAIEAAIVAGATRLRPVLMTAAAMVVGLIPMAVGLGEGAEQNAALARALVGGVSAGTLSTLFLVPFLYSQLRRAQPKPLEMFP